MATAGSSGGAAATHTVALDEIARFLDGYLGVEGARDYPHALNGLQVEGPATVERVAVAVDASEAVIAKAGRWADLLFVHHGLFWGGLQPLTGPLYRRVRGLVGSGTALYSCHLPLDRHPEVGNAALVARGCGVRDLEPFGDYRGSLVGWMGEVATTSVAGLRESLANHLGGPVRVVPGGPEQVTRVGIVTGAGGSTLPEARTAGLDALITGEAGHHSAVDAREAGVSLLLGGHYATEVGGVRAVASLLEDRFGVQCRFVDSPTGF